jgi:SAM-dependent methyltransferase
MKYFKMLRTIKRLMDKMRSLVLFPFVYRDYATYKRKDKERRFSLVVQDAMPCLFENIPYTRFDTHYVYHTAWAARKVKELAVSKHVDISSSLYFSSIVSAFVPVDFYDYRPAKLGLSNLKSQQGDLLKLPFADNSLSSISCMHTIEHVGLGRYGDPLDPDGDRKAIKELIRVTKKGGAIIFVVPVGRPRIQFNAHRIYSYEIVLDLFSGCLLKEFSLIPDNALESGMIFNASPSIVSLQSYGCGCFVFVK